MKSKTTINPFKIIGRFIRYIRREELQLREMAIGFNSFIDKEKDLHLIMLDYDTKDEGFVKKDVYDLIRFWNLSGADMFSTKNGFHVFFWHDHVPYSRLRMIIDYSRCDTMYKYISKYYDYKTIRACGKYKDLDIEWQSHITGIRLPNEVEKELGNLKREEYFQLRKMHSGFVRAGLK